jgi:phosphoenolpyruvate carboxylase
LWDLNELEFQLAISLRFLQAMDELAASIPQGTHAREKYRRVISHLRKCLVKTARDCENQLEEYLKPEQLIFLRTKTTSSTLTEDVESVDDSLEATYKADDCYTH